MNLNECTERCDLLVLGKCDVLREMPEMCDYRCPFYKPYGCGDWVRTGDEIYPPEEFERKVKRNEKIAEQKKLYWTLKRMPVGKG